jgi:hypothetical protein
VGEGCCILQSRARVRREISREENVSKWIHDQRRIVISDFAESNKKQVDGEDTRENGERVKGKG